MLIRIFLLQHDSTLWAHLTMLGVFDNKKPQYTACVITELHEPRKGEYYVRILYKNDPYHNRQPDLLKLNGEWITVQPCYNLSLYNAVE